jgi:hypothetical protein
MNLESKQDKEPVSKDGKVGEYHGCWFGSVHSISSQIPVVILGVRYFIDAGQAVGLGALE